MRYATLHHCILHYCQCVQAENNHKKANEKFEQYSEIGKQGKHELYWILC